jgi:purine-binding chemotaxis protein CheW
MGVMETYLMIVLAGGEFCLRASATREVIPWVEPRRLPSGNPTLVGVVPLRAGLVPVYDLAAPFGLPPGRGSIVIIDDGGEAVGLAVDEVRELVFVEDDSFRPAPSSSVLVDGALSIDDRIVMRLRSPLGIEDAF